MPPEPRYNIRRIVIIGIIVLIVGGLIGFYFINRARQQNGGDTPGTNNFPFPGQQGTNPSGVSTDGVSIDETSEGPFTVQSGERLRRITDYPVTGFSAFERTKIVSEAKLDEATGETRLVSVAAPITTVRYNVKQNGHIIDAEVARDSIVVSEKSTTEVPAAEDIWFGTNGNPAFFRTWNDSTRRLSTLLGMLPEPGALGYCETMLTQDIKKGTKGTEVATLQRYLQVTLNVPVTADGSFGSKTSDILKQAQKNLGIPQTGVVDAATRNAINTDCAKRISDATAESEKPAPLRASFLQDNILRGTTSPDGSKIFFLVNNGTGVTGIVANRDGTNQKNIFVSPFTEWMPQWASAETIAMTTLASREAPGYLYFLNPATGAFTKVIGPVRGLTTLTSPDAKRVLYSSSTDQGIVTALYEVATGNVRALDLSTLPEKCGWKDPSMAYCGIPKSVANAAYPDAWYQGTLTFEDNLWSINAQTGATAMIMPSQLSFDITKVSFSPDKAYVFFINWIDQTLWSYRLSE